MKTWLLLSLLWGNITGFAPPFILSQEWLQSAAKHKTHLILRPLASAAYHPHPQPLSHQGRGGQEKFFYTTDATERDMNLFVPFLPWWEKGLGDEGVNLVPLLPWREKGLGDVSAAARSAGVNPVPLLPGWEKGLGDVSAAARSAGVNLDTLALKSAILEKQVVPTQRMCQLSAYVIDRDPQGLNIRNSPNPNAQIMGNLPTYDQTMTVNIIASQGSWVQINQADGDSGKVFQGRGWVYAPLLGTSTRGYARKSVTVYANPNNRSRVIGRIPDQVSVKLLSCDRQWAYVSYQRLQGWLAPIDQCPNALTTCP